MQTKQKSGSEPAAAAKKKPPSGQKLEQRRGRLASESSALVREANSLVAKPVMISEQRFKLEYSRMLKFNSRLISRLNKQLEGALTARDIYALSTLMSQQREVINDLRAIADMSQQVAMIGDQAINPFMSDMTQLVTDVYYQLRKLTMETSKPKETQFALTQLDELVKQMGIGMQTGHGVLRQSIEGILLSPAKADTVKNRKKARVS